MCHCQHKTAACCCGEPWLQRLAPSICPVTSGWWGRWQRGMYLRPHAASHMNKLLHQAARRLHEDRPAGGAGSQGVQRTPKQRRRHGQGHREHCWADQSGQHAAHQQGHRARAQWRPRAQLCACAVACHVGSALSCTAVSPKALLFEGRRARCRWPPPGRAPLSFVGLACLRLLVCCLCGARGRIYHRCAGRARATLQAMATSKRRCDCKGAQQCMAALNTTASVHTEFRGSVWT